MLELAEEHGPSIIEVPTNLPWIDIGTPIMALIINEQVCRLRGSERVHHMFSDVILSGGSLDGMARTRAGPVRNPVVALACGLDVVADADAPVAGRGLNLGGPVGGLRTAASCGRNWTPPRGKPRRD
ncbi:MAG TPA: hypothetical protein DCM14_00815 [Clostridiales bacterium UBA8153]|nr:hypothetical protein [Clostridiales bacterium UBA8153]